ncbi:MAG: hypothetical protein HQL37_13495 [Alphaproteobacteria bacterium]|nr:hypothetical protein [Alphaproteobacteria bacterium]
MNQWVLALVVLAAATMGLSIAHAEPGSQKTPVVVSESEQTDHPATTATANQPEVVVKPATIDGYRSARFGMTEAEVKKAIREDFGADDSTRVTNDAERTNVLVVSGKTLITGTPPAVVSYIFGASSSKLIQVNIVWGEGGGADAKQIVPATNALVAYFLDRGSYRKENQVVNQPLPDGTFLAFRGADAWGHMVILHLAPAPDPNQVKKKVKDKAPELKKAVLRLSYIENPINPDVFHIEKGAF